MKMPILGQAYVARSVNAADNRMVNLFPEATPENGKDAGFLNRAPGLRLLATLAGVSGPGEQLKLRLRERRGNVRLDVALPASLAARKAGTELPENGYAGQYIIDWATEMPDDADPLEWGYERALTDQHQVLASLRLAPVQWLAIALIIFAVAGSTLATARRVLPPPVREAADATAATPTATESARPAQRR